MFDKKITFLPIMNSKRNSLKKRIFPLLVPREYVVLPSEPGVFIKIEDSSKEIKRRFYPYEEALHREPIDKLPRVWHECVGRDLKNPKKLYIKRKMSQTLVFNHS